MLDGSRPAARQASSRRGSWRVIASNTVSGVPRPAAGGADGDPVPPVQGCQPQALGPAGGNRQGEWLLHGPGRAGRLGGGVVGSSRVMSGRRARRRRSAAAPAGTPRIGRVVPPLSTAPARARWRRGLRNPAQTEVEAAIAQVIEREGVPGQRDGMPEVRRGDERAQADALGDGGRGSQHGHGGVPGPVGHAAPADVVVGPAPCGSRRDRPTPTAAGPRSSGPTGG